MNRVFSLIPAIIFAGFNLVSGFSADLTTSLWKPVELDIRLKHDAARPYWSDEITGFFYHEKDTIAVKAFWYDKDHFKIRFTPAYTGTWRYKAIRGKAVIQKGSVKVSPASDGYHGFVRRDSAHPYHFIRDDGTRYFMFGTTYYNMVLNALAGDRWKTAIDSAMAFGINKCRVFASSEKGARTPYSWASPFLKITDSLDYRRLNSEYWKALDKVVEYSLEKGMVVDLIMLGYGAKTYSVADLDRKYIQYLIARYAAYTNIIWCLTNEWNYIYRDHKRDKPFWNSLGEMIRNEDPYMCFSGQFRLLSIHQQTRVDFQFYNYDWPVHAIVQLGVRNGQGSVKDEWDNVNKEFKPATRFADEWGNYSILFNMGHNMPVVNDEYGYIGEQQDRSESRDGKTMPAFTREKHRHVMWGIVLGGGYGSTGDKTLYSDESPYFSANWHSSPAEYRDVKILTDFFSSGMIEYWKMSASNNIIKVGARVYALSETGRQYLFYSAEGNSFIAGLEPGKYKASIIDPVSGQKKDAGIVDGGIFRSEHTGKEDWLIYLRAL